MKVYGETAFCCNCCISRTTNASIAGWEEERVEEKLPIIENGNNIMRLRPAFHFDKMTESGVSKCGSV